MKPDRRRRVALLLAVTCAAPAAAQQGAVRRVHDPVIIRERDTYYVFSTGPGIPVRRSKDLIHCEHIGRVFEEDVPAWAKAEIPRAEGVWAPDISHYGGEFHLYYSVSTMGNQRSCIGLATNRTLDPASKDYRWVDHGKVLESFPGRMDYNAIDPNLVLDEAGDPWLVFGSYWSGIKAVRLDRQTGKPSRRDDRIYPLAARPPNGPIEGAFVVHRKGWYWLFVSFDRCCLGVASNYKVMVGRSRRITGPYMDVQNRPMLEGGGTLVLAGHDHCRGPGHNGILLTRGGDWMVHHMYDAHAGGVPTMQIRPLYWLKDGWPVVGEPLDKPLPASRPVRSALLAGTWRHCVNFGPEQYVELPPDGRMNSPAAGARWDLDEALLHLRWPRADRPGEFWIDTCVVGRDGRSYVGRNQNGDLIRGIRP